MSSVTAFLLAAVLGAETSVTAGIRTEGRARHLDPAPVPAQTEAVDVTATPWIGLRLADAGTSFWAGYNPRISAVDIGPDMHWEQMHQGELRLRVAPSTVWSLEAYANGGIGRTDLLTESRSAAAGPGTGGTGTTGTGGTGTTGTGGTGATGTAAGAGNTIATLETVDLQRWGGGLAFRLAPDRRTDVLLSAAYTEDGGASSSSRKLVPISRGPDATAELRWAATQLDWIGLRLTGAERRMPALGTNSAWVDALATWRHRLSAPVDFWLGAGAVLLWSDLPAGALGHQASGEPHFSGEIGVAHSGPPLFARLTGAVSATVDRITGVATPQAEVRGDLRWPVTTRVTLVGRGAGSLAWPEAGRTWRGQADLGAAFRLGPRLSIDLGGYGSRQNSTDPAVLDLTEYGAFLGLVFDAPPIRF